jgi:hypothetical protein
MTLGTVLGSEAGFTLITAIVGSIWTALRSSEWAQQARGRRYAKAVEALEAGVELTYRTYVREIKQLRQDGKLTDDEMREARQRARDAAVEFGRTQGLDVVRELGAQYVDLAISKLVKKLKG